MVPHRWVATHVGWPRRVWERFQTLPRRSFILRCALARTSAAGFFYVKGGDAGTARTAHAAFLAAHQLSGRDIGRSVPLLELDFGACVVAFRRTLKNKHDA